MGDTTIDSTQSFTLVDSVTRADQVWYRMDLEKKEYVLDVSVRSATKEAIGFSFDILRPFGDAETQIVGDSAYDFILSSSDTFEPEVVGPAWIRLENAYDSEPALEFTVTAQ